MTDEEQIDPWDREPAIGAEQFEREYAQRSKITVETLRARGRVVRRCRCSYEECQGWQSISQEMVDISEADWARGVGPRPHWIEDDK